MANTQNDKYLTEKVLAIYGRKILIIVKETDKHFQILEGCDYHYGGTLTRE